MLCQAAKKLDLQTIILTDDSDAPAQNFCDEFICSNYAAKDNLEKFAKTCDIITFEFENIPFETLNNLSTIKPVFLIQILIKFYKIDYLKKTMSMI